MHFIFRDSLNHRFSVHPTPNAVQPLFQPGYFFTPQQLSQQVQFAALTVTNTAAPESSKGKGKEKRKEKPKAADWSVQESKQLLYAWAPRFERLKGASNKVRTAIWNEIFFEEFKSSCDESERTLTQVKKRQQNLEYEFKQLKLNASKTGEEGLNKIKENFPYYSIFGKTIGCRDSVDPARIEINKSSFIPSSAEAESTSQLISSSAKESKKSAPSAACSSESEGRPSTSAGVKRGCNQMRVKEPRKKKRGKSDEANGTDEWSAFKEMWEKNLHQENERFEKSMKMFQENQKMQMAQTASLLSGFKDVMKDLRKE